MTASLPAVQASWTPTSLDAAETSSESDTEFPSSEPLVECTDGVKHPPRGEGFTTRKGKDYRPASTYYLKPWSQKTLSEAICSIAYRPEMETMFYVKTIDRGPIPRGSVLADNAFIIPAGMLPIVVQHAAHLAFPGTPFLPPFVPTTDADELAGFKWPFLLAYAFYATCFIIFAGLFLERLNSTLPPLPSDPSAHHFPCQRMSSAMASLTRRTLAETGSQTGASILSRVA